MDNDVLLVDVLPDEYCEYHEIYDACSTIDVDLTNQERNNDIKYGREVTYII